MLLAAEATRKPLIDFVRSGALIIAEHVPRVGQLRRLVSEHVVGVGGVVEELELFSDIVKQRALPRVCDRVGHPVHEVARVLRDVMSSRIQDREVLGGATRDRILRRTLRELLAKALERCGHVLDRRAVPEAVELSDHHRLGEAPRVVRLRIGDGAVDLDVELPRVGE